ncbi:MAG: zf-HC2 domain-containing protein [Xanthomonadales bacterium]|nr:zf-HC2 domain-containing protein [Gammaproteobacteria bacterium]MBT8057444.1 zf-HC2 domain-containing protein [Gammaproteobacteria bacterium]NNL05716.1 zf-HC2 domain-containing protein [Xanthomonadales bacterium]
MHDASRIHSNEHVGERLSGYLDGELTQQDCQRVDLHLADCAECRGLLNELQVLRERLGQSTIGGRNEQEWRESMDDLGVTLSRGIGWVLLLAAAVIIVGTLVVLFLTDPGVPGGWKFLIGLFYTGLLILFVSVLRQRWIEHKTDKYKDVEI